MHPECHTLGRYMLAYLFFYCIAERNLLCFPMEWDTVKKNKKSLFLFFYNGSRWATYAYTPGVYLQRKENN